MMYIFAHQRDILLSMQSQAVAQLVEIDSGNTHVTDWVSPGFSSAHSMRPWMKKTHQAMLVVRLNYSLLVMCFVMMENHVWWPQWIHWWCWTALCGFPPRCSAQLWAAGSYSLRLGLNWWCCPTQSLFPGCSAACCSELWIVTSSDEVWSPRWLPGLWIHVSAWQQLNHDVKKTLTLLTYYVVGYNLDIGICFSIRRTQQLHRSMVWYYHIIVYIEGIPSSLLIFPVGLLLQPPKCWAQ